MIDRRIPSAGDPFTAGMTKPAPGTTRHHRCDHRFLAILEHDFGIEQADLSAAFMGVPPAPQRQAIELCEWAIRSAGGDPYKAGDALRAWARKHRTGTYSPRMQDPEPPTFGGREQAGV